MDEPPECDFYDSSGFSQITLRHSKLFLKTQLIYFGEIRKRDPLHKHSQEWPILDSSRTQFSITSQ